MYKQIKYGMVGGSLHAFIGDVHRKAIGFDTRAELACGCFSSSKQDNLDTGEMYGVAAERIYSNYAEMAAAESSRPDGIDFVSIVTPNYLHYEAAKAFLDAGINVVCEKPLCFTVQQAEELKRLADEKNLVFGVMYAYTGYVMVKVAKEMAAAGKLGEIVSVNAEFPQEWLIDDLNRKKPESDRSLSIWRKDPSKAGISNCVGDLGTHVENMVHYITGLNIKKLCATVNRFGHPLELNANMLIEYDNGANGAYWCSQIALGNMNSLIVRIYGTEGSLEWEQHFPDYLRFTPKSGAPITLSRGCDYLKGSAAALSRLPFGHPEGLFVGFANVYQNIISAIIKKKAGQPLTEQDLDFPSAADGLNGVKFVHAVITSADNGSAWVNV